MACFRGRWAGVAAWSQAPFYLLAAKAAPIVPVKLAAYHPKDNRFFLASHRLRGRGERSKACLRSVRAEPVLCAACCWLDQFPPTCAYRSLLSRKTATLPSRRNLAKKPAARTSVPATPSSSPPPNASGRCRTRQWRCRSRRLRRSSARRSATCAICRPWSPRSASGSGRARPTPTSSSAASATAPIMRASSRRWVCSSTTSIARAPLRRSPTCPTCSASKCCAGRSRRCSARTPRPVSFRLPRRSRSSNSAARRKRLTATMTSSSSRVMSPGL